MLDRAEVIIPVGLPVVIIDSDARDPYVVVDTDQEQGTRLATQHLLDLGHRCIVHVSGPDTSFSATRREAAWAATMRDAGVDPQPVLKGTGPPPPGIGTVSSWPVATTSPRSSRRTTRWRSASCTRSTSRAGRSRATSV
nr:hypothetical protein GCM10025699_62120 [Microbacterium flavescens]